VLQEAGYFMRRNINQLHLKNELTTPVDLIKASLHTVDVYKVQDKLHRLKYSTHILEKDYTQTTEVDASGGLYWLMKTLLMPALQTIPSEVNGNPLNLNVTMGFALGMSTVFGLADLWLSCQLEMLYKHESIQAIINAY
jgi:hypothetical protein